MKNKEYSEFEKEHYEKMDRITEAGLTHLKRFSVCGDKYSQIVVDFSDFGKYVLPEKREEFAVYILRLITSLEEWGEIAIDIGEDIQNLVNSQMEFCEYILEELEKE